MLCALDIDQLNDFSEIFVVMLCASVPALVLHFIPGLVFDEDRISAPKLSITYKSINQINVDSKKQKLIIHYKNFSSDNAEWTIYLFLYQITMVDLYALLPGNIPIIFDDEEK